MLCGAVYDDGFICGHHYYSPIDDVWTLRIPRSVQEQFGTGLPAAVPTRASEPQPLVSTNTLLCPYSLILKVFQCSTLSFSVGTKQISGQNYDSVATSPYFGMAVSGAIGAQGLFDTLALNAQAAKCWLAQVV